MEIGRIIIEKQEAYNWGNSIVENLAKDLQNEFPKVKGFSSQNLWRMRKFYDIYKESKKLAPMVREISWKKMLLFMKNVKMI